MEQGLLVKRLINWSAIVTMVAGVIHIWIIPEHWEHAPGHAVFFAFVGILQIIWGIWVWQKPSDKLYYAGAVMSGWLIVLYLLTRWLPAPFGHGPEGIHTIDIVCKFAEGLGMVTATMLILQGLAIKSTQKLAWRSIISILVLSVVTGIGTYGLARAAEPIFPMLSISTEEHHHGDDAEHEEEHEHQDGDHHNEIQTP